MNTTDSKYTAYIRILKKELVPAMGCTEPIALAYCAAKARSILGAMPSKVIIEASGNIIKNIKSVTVPHTGGKKGMEAAVSIGIIAGNESGGLEVLTEITDEQTALLEDYLKNTEFHIQTLDSTYSLDIILHAIKGEDEVTVRIVDKHTNVVLIEKNGVALLQKEVEACCALDMTDYNTLTMEDIYDFALTLQIDDIKDIFDRQIAFNTAISQEGLSGNYGANIGSVLLTSCGDGIRNRAKAVAAAGSDARMNGCELPVIINSGSGNQGMTTSLPVIEYAKELGASAEALYRALAISNLTAIHLKTGIGTLSAYCGAVSAGAAAGAAIAYLQGGDYDAICNTVANSLAITSGIICDGAKASCAAKIATAVDAGIFGYEMHKCGQKFYGGDGIVSDEIEKTIRNIGLIGKDGMRETDKEILTIMTTCD